MEEAMVYFNRSKTNELGMGSMEHTEYFGLMGRAKKQYCRCLEPVSKKWALTQNELNVLLFLYNNPQYDRAADIVVCRGISKSHVSLSVNSLEGRGLLRRFVSDDRRTAHLELTEQGRTIAQEGREAQLSYFTELYRGITPEEFDLWRKITQKVCENIESFDKA